MSETIEDLVGSFDRWTRDWNEDGSDRARSRVIEFLGDWRSDEGNWLEDTSRRFFDRSAERGLFVDRWPDGINGVIQRLHLANQTIWHLEDEARRDDVDDSTIVEIKRGIDAINQQRNDQMEAIDEWVIKETEARVDDESLPVHSEPPGLMVDRLSILSLKMFFYDTVDNSDKRDRLEEQRRDLFQALERLWGRLENNDVRVKIYRQFKTYNQPETNPALSDE